jgi:hypothetical protein
MVIAILLTLATIEVLAIAALSLPGGYVPARARFAREANRYVAEVTGFGRGCQYIDALFPHPYLGIVHHRNPPCGMPNVNNIGLFGADFPSERVADRFVILVTGGSVAAQFAQITPGGPKYLETILNRSYLSPTGKPFLVLNGGAGGWKQPQQAILFLLWSDVVDAVVTLDGFNEAERLDKPLRMEYPGPNFAVVNPLTKGSYDQVVARWFLGRLIGWATNNPVISRSQAAYMAIRGVRRLVNHQMGGNKGRETTATSLFSLPPEWDREKQIESAIAQYRKYIRSMNAIARDRNIRSAYFIQPVPAIGKRLTVDERTVVGDLGYGPLYRRMTDALLDLRRERIPIFSMLDIFAGVEDTLYDDPIHLKFDNRGESLGYQLMAERMAATLAEVWQLRARR